MAHTPKLKAPYYADQTDGTVLHRYMDDQFVTRFFHDAANGKLTANHLQSWRQTDRFDSYGKAVVTVRQPIHRTFYMVSCEVCCDQMGEPAFDPSKVISGGMVVRRGNEESFTSWQVREGKALGWQQTSAQQSHLEPDYYRRLLNKRLIQPKSPKPAYSGEQTHPLRATLVDQTDAKGQNRKRTLLAGYLPLGGVVEAESSLAESDNSNARSGQVSAAGQLAEFEWPFGSWDGQSTEPTVACSGSLSSVAVEVCGHFSWHDRDGLQVIGGVPQSAFIPFLRTLLERFHVHDGSISANEALRTLLSEIRLYIYQGPRKLNDFGVQNRIPSTSLLVYINSHYERLIEWFVAHDRGVATSRLPGLNGNQDLLISENQAASLREQLVMRFEEAERMVDAALPLPRFSQGERDVYFVKPFIRYLDDCGCEKIAWGPASEPFRVASVLDPEASRPSVIQLPELKDIKRGFANGVTFLTPKSLADKIEQLSPDLEFKKHNKKNRLQACMGYSISFSIPIVTICAMILLMIIVSLLNFIFHWLPWVILKLPRRCK